MPGIRRRQRDGGQLRFITQFPYKEGNENANDRAQAVFYLLLCLLLLLPSERTVGKPEESNGRRRLDDTHIQITAQRCAYPHSQQI